MKPMRAPPLKKGNQAMTRPKISLALAAAVLALAACAGPEIAPPSIRAAYLQDAAARIKAADWSKAATIEVGLDEFSFAPATLRFRAGQPVRLRLKNTGGFPHYFYSPAFFKAVAVKNVSSAKGEDTTPYRLAIKLEPGEQKDLYFVPVKKGTYGLECTVFGHARFGMTGKIRIEE